MGTLTRTIFVGGIKNLDEQVLRDLCSPFGEIRNISIPVDHNTQLARGYGFVEFDQSEEAEAAIDNLHDSEVNGQTLTVDFARLTKQMPTNDQPIWVTDDWLQKYAQGAQISVPSTVPNRGEA